MTSKELIQSTMLNNIFISRLTFDVPVDAGDDGVVIFMSVNVFIVDTRSDVAIVGLAGDSIALLAGEVIDGLLGGMIGVGVGMLTEFGIVVVVAATIALNVFVTVSCVGDVRVGVWTGTAIDSDVTTVTRVGMVVVLIADTITGFVSGIDVDVLAGVDATADLGFIDTRVSLEESLDFCC